MKNKLKCPFCGAELVSDPEYLDSEHFHCENEECIFPSGVELHSSVWKKMIDGKKAQDALKSIADDMFLYHPSISEEIPWAKHYHRLKNQARSAITSITKQEERAMKEYHKIETLYKRDMDGTKKLLVGEFRNPAIEMLKNVCWVGKEKIDGTNIRIHWDGHRVEIGGRTDKAEIHKDLLSYLHNTFCTPEAEQVFEEKFGEKDVFLFGEGYGAGIQKGGGLYRADKGFILFDVSVDDVFLPVAAIEEIATAFGVPPIKVLCKGTLEDLVNFVKSNPLSQCSEQPRTIEGVVASPVVEMRDQYGKRMIVKIKCEDFVS